MAFAGFAKNMFASKEVKKQMRYVQVIYSAEKSKRLLFWSSETGMGKPYYAD
ncbi:MAG: hypothetical protein PHC92_08535 [Syntrophomonadaceae bacterium]|nr:hypothetical protein [Syntrophomonadaceae bacterium]MDD3023335.1 hypothetical protein [Syntrophomonadaceae bacterium]